MKIVVMAMPMMHEQDRQHFPLEIVLQETVQLENECLHKYLDKILKKVDGKYNVNCEKRWLPLFLETRLHYLAPIAHLHEAEILFSEKNKAIYVLTMEPEIPNAETYRELVGKYEFQIGLSDDSSGNIVFLMESPNENGDLILNGKYEVLSYSIGKIDRTKILHLLENV